MPLPRMCTYAGLLLTLVALSGVDADEVKEGRDSLAVVIPRSIQIEHGGQGDELGMEPANADTVWFLAEPGYAYGTVVSFLVSWEGAVCLRDGEWA